MTSQIVCQSWFVRHSLGFVGTANQIVLQDNGQEVFVVLVQLEPSKFSLRCFTPDVNDTAPTDDLCVAATIAECANRGTLLDVFEINQLFTVQLVDAAGFPKHLRISTSERTVLLSACNNSERNCPSTMENFATVLSNAQQVVRIQVPDDVESTVSHRSSLSNRISRLSQRLSRGGSRKLLPTKSSARPRLGSHLDSTLVDEAEEWKQDITTLLRVPERRQGFREFLKFSFADENIDFIDAVEMFEGLPESSAEFKKTHDQIIEEFIRPGSKRQVNLPFHLSRALLTGQEPTRGVFDHAKDEILELVQRNFFQRYVEQTEEQMRRSKQIKDLSGSFAAMWRISGVDALFAIDKQFGPARSDCDKLAKFFQARMDVIELEASSNYEVAREFAYAAPSKGNSRSMQQARYSAVHACQLRSQALMGFVGEMEKFAKNPMQDLSETIRTSLLEIKGRCQSALEDIMHTRKEVIRMQVELERVQTEKREYTANLKPSQKPKKKVAKQLEKLNQQVEAAIEECDKARLLAQTAESKHEDTMLFAMDAFESLELHRLEKQHEILTQAALIELNLCNRLSIIGQPCLDDAIAVDAVREIVSFAGTVGSNAQESRPKTMRRPRLG